MRGIPNQNHPAGMPFFELRPLHSRANDLLVTLERGQIFLNAATECREALAKPLEASLQRIGEAWLDDIGETVGASSPHRHKPERAAIAWVHLQSRQVGRANRGNAPPVHRTEIVRRRSGISPTLCGHSHGDQAVGDEDRQPRPRVSCTSLLLGDCIVHFRFCEGFSDAGRRSGGSVLAAT